MTVDGFSLGAVSSHEFTDITADYHLDITFVEDAPVLWTITPTAVGNGTITPSTPVQVESGVETYYFVFNPDAGFLVAEILVDGVPQALANDLTYPTITADSALTVTFGVDIGATTYVVTVDQRDNGTITPTTDVTALAGTNVNFTIVPNTNFTVDALFIDEIETAASATHTFTAISADHSIRARYIQDISGSGCGIELMKMEEVTIRRRDFDAGSYNIEGYRVVGDSIEFTILANYQPGNQEQGIQAVGIQVIQNAEYDYLNRSWKFFTADEVKEKDIIIISNGEEYEVLDVDDWTRYPTLHAINYRSTARRIKE